MTPGTRVQVVAALDLTRWNRTAAEVLQSATGTVERVKDDYDFAWPEPSRPSRVGVLVAFDPPLPGIHSTQPTTGFWFHPSELKVLP